MFWPTSTSTGIGPRGISAPCLPNRRDRRRRSGKDAPLTRARCAAGRSTPSWQRRSVSMHARVCPGESSSSAASGSEHSLRLYRQITSYKMLPLALPACFKIGMARGRSRTKETLARNAVRLRRLRKFSQAELAARARVTQALVSAIELSRANPTVESLDRIAAALGVGIGELFGG